MEASQQPKKFQFVKKEAFMNGEPYVPTPVKDKKDAMNAVLSVVLNHTADVFRGVIDAISEHYKIDKDEMMDIVTSHPAYTSIVLNPVLNDLGYLSKEEAVPPPEPKPKKSTTKKVVPRTPEPVPVPEPEPVPVPTPSVEPTPKKKFVIKKKTVQAVADSRVCLN